MSYQLITKYNSYKQFKHTIIDLIWINFKFDPTVLCICCQFLSVTVMLFFMVAENTLLCFAAIFAEMYLHFLIYLQQYYKLWLWLGTYPATWDLHILVQGYSTTLTWERLFSFSIHFSSFSFQFYFGRNLVWLLVHYLLWILTSIWYIFLYLDKIRISLYMPLQCIWLLCWFSDNRYQWVSLLIDLAEFL